MIISVFLPSASVVATSPYESGYDHGCDDAKISDPSDRYINQPEKGPAYHTSEFMDGYYSGYDKCSSNNDSNDDDDDIRNSNTERSIDSSSNYNLHISSATSYFERNYFYIVGEVLNTGSNDKEFVRVIATLYDKQNNVIGTQFTYTDPSTIQSEESAPFKLIIGESDVSSINTIDDYKIVATAD
ncbi:MAG: FxLYD domain-containing protein [Candidatus Nitrosocosmicus sp.]|nr:FxLYD domain-containing protein [Candidatus Nitrosocosmicus sp.]